MDDRLDVSYLGEEYSITLNPEAALRIGEAVIAVCPAKARITWFFTGFTAPEERLESEVYANHDVLQYLRVHFAQSGVRFLEFGKAIYLRIQRRTLARLVVRVSTLGKKMVVQTTTLPQGLDHLPLLDSSRIQAISKGLSCHDTIFA